MLARVTGVDVHWGSGGGTSALSVPPVATASEGAFEDRYRSLFLAAMRVAFRVTADRAAAEDVAAEAMARAYANWRKVSALPYLDAWVQRVAANLAIDVVRRRRPQSDATRRIEDELRSRVSVDLESATVERHALVSALAKLPQRQREVLVLRYLVGMEDDELASTLQMSTSTARTHVQRGLHALRQRLGGLEGARS